jgi:outer membrane protein assembly factor BamB
VYVCSPAPTLTLFALTHGTGSKLWSLAFSSSSFQSPAIGPDGTIYLQDGASLNAVK